MKANTAEPIIGSLQEMISAMMLAYYWVAPWITTLASLLKSAIVFKEIIHNLSKNTAVSYRIGTL